MTIYENYLAPHCSRPLEIIKADGNILTNAYHRAHQAHGGGLKDGIRALLHFDHHVQEEEQWWEEMMSQLLDVRNREYIGFYGNARARPSTIRSFLGLRGQPYLCWSDRRTLRPDVFDALEWACFQTVYVALPSSSLYPALLSFSSCPTLLLLLLLLLLLFSHYLSSLSC